MKVVYVFFHCRLSPRDPCTVVATLDLIHLPRFQSPPVDRMFADVLLPTVDPVSDRASHPPGFLRQPFHGNLPVQLPHFGTKLVLFASIPTPVLSCQHILHQRPHVLSVGVVNDNLSTRSSGLTALILMYPGDICFVVYITH